MTIRKITILGAGHGGCAAAADLSTRGFEVCLQSRSEDRLQPIRNRGGIEARGIHKGFVPIRELTTNVGDAVDGADLVMLVTPSIAHESYARALAPVLRPDIPIFLNPGHTCGGLHFVHELRKAGYKGKVRCCETVTLTYICRMEGPATVGIYCYTRKLQLGAFPGKHTEGLNMLIHSLFPEVVPASSVLETALSNMNAVFHPPGMLMNTGWIESTSGNFLFYNKGITEAVGRVVSAVDAERMAIARALGVPCRSFIQTFYEAGLTTKEAFESGSVARVCHESEPNRTIKSPSSLDDRYIHEDVGFGLVPMTALARLAGIETPSIDALIHLVSEATGIRYNETGLTLKKMGLQGIALEDLFRFVQDG